MLRGDFTCFDIVVIDVWFVLFEVDLKCWSCFFLCRYEVIQALYDVVHQDLSSEIHPKPNHLCSSQNCFPSNATNRCILYFSICNTDTFLKGGFLRWCLGLGGLGGLGFTRKYIFGSRSPRLRLDRALHARGEHGTRPALSERLAAMRSQRVLRLLPGG